MDIIEIDYKCLNCGEIFKAKQGSRKRYCPNCIVIKLMDRHYIKGKCEMCGKEKNLVKHHLNYDMFSNKVPGDKIAHICISCHSKIHGKYQNKHPKAITLNRSGKIHPMFKRKLGRPRKVNVKPLELNKDKLNEIKDLIPRKG